MAVKYPFERIISLVDRRKLFTELVQLKSAIIIKLSDNQVVSFRGLQVSPEGHLHGLANEKALEGASQRTVVVFFYSARDRYFVNTKLVRVTSGGWKILNSTDFYRLNRRESYRTIIPESIQISLQVTSINGSSSRLQARVNDFSAGGLRIRWTSSPMENGTLLKGNLIWLKGREIPIEAAVKHRAKDGTYGIEFQNLDSLQMNRFRILNIELQQIVNYSKS